MPCTTANAPLPSSRPRRALADRGRLHHQPRRQDRSRRRRRRTVRRARTRPRRMRALCALRRDGRGRRCARSRPWRADDRARPRPRRRCSRRCRRAPRATRSIARSGILQPSAPAGRRTSSPALPPPQAARHRLHDLARRRRTAMAAAAEAAADRPLLKVKLGARGRSGAHRGGAPRRAERAELIVDANEGWTPRKPRRQPRRLRGGRRDAGRAAAARRPRRRAVRRSGARSRSAPTKACTDAPRLPALAGKYDAVNIKLDKTGGLTEALALAEDARTRSGFSLMVGCMVATSLAMAPATAGGAARARRRSRRAAAAGARPARWTALRWQPGASAVAGAVGMKRRHFRPLPASSAFEDSARRHQGNYMMFKNLS